MAVARNLPEKTARSTTPQNSNGGSGALQTLVPVVELRQSLVDLSNILVQNQNGAVDINVLLDQVIRELDGDSGRSSINKKKTRGSTSSSSSIPRDEKGFKAIFDAYSDTVSYKQRFVDQNAFLVYYTRGYDGPGRPNIEDDLSTMKQTQQYGARNDAWVGWENFIFELDYLKQNKEEKNDNNSDDNNDDDIRKELVRYLSDAIASMDRYLSLAPPDDVRMASLELLGVK